MTSAWFHNLAIASLAIGGASALALFADTRRHPQHLRIMDVVWPITGLYAGPLGLWGYFRFGRNIDHGADRGRYSAKPFAASVGIADLHCGAGCTLGDILSEWLAHLLPAITIWFGYRSIFADRIFAVWTLDFLLAFLFGIGFQYLAIARPRGLSSRAAIIDAIKSDALTVTTWQIGMYGFIGLANFGYLGGLLGQKPPVTTPEFWFLMQIAMIVGFATAYPMTWWLVRTGVKDGM